jgi:exopolysaccharide biosynthesis polyprenyl glycosylphosphotransferase
VSSQPQNFELYDDLFAAVGTPTRDVLAWRSHRSHRRGWLVRRALLAADLIGLVTAFLVTEAVMSELGGGGATHLLAEYFLFASTLPAWVIAAKLYGLYDRDEELTDHSTADEFVNVLHMVLVGTWLFVLLNWWTHIAKPSATKFALFGLLAVVLISGFRAIGRALCRRSLAYVQNTVIVGAGEIGQLMARKYLQHPEYGVNLVGFVDRNPRERVNGLAHVAMLGEPEQLAELVKLFDIDRVVIAFSNESHEEIIELIRSLKDLIVQIDIVPRLFEVLGSSVAMHTVEGVPLIGLRPFRLAKSSKLLKRAMDIVVAGIALLVLAPVLAAIALLIKLDSRGPVIFRQIRVGTRGKTFSMLKFRTMAIDADSRKSEIAHLNKHAQPGGDSRMFKVLYDPRVTKVGRVLRRYSLDELPQFVNVLQGRMSLVGPRPLILEEARHVEAWAETRLDLKPGITGIWQVSGRSGIPFAEMVRLDYLYVTNWTLFGDFALLARTIPVALRGDRDETYATLPAVANVAPLPVPPASSPGLVRGR